MANMPKVWPTVVHMLADAAVQSPDKEALRCQDKSLSYQAYAACVASLALELQGQGIGRGDRVVLLMGNSMDVAIATMGVQASGAQLAPLNPAYTLHELKPILEDCAASAIIYDQELSERLADLLKAFAPQCRIAVGEGVRRLSACPDEPRLVKQLPLPDPDGLSTLQYTGGTTGRSKGVNLTHEAIALNVSQREALLPIRKECERLLAPTPLFHVYAVAMGLYLAIYARASLEILPRYHPEKVLDLIENNRITLLAGSPTLFIGLMNHDKFKDADLSSLRLTFSGAAALSSETLRRWEAATGSVVCEGYGQSESGPVLTFNPSEGVRKIGTVGIAVPKTRIEIVDIETGQLVLPVGEIGEIRVKGAQLMQGYRNLPTQTAEALRDGWLYTGDIGKLDEQGYLTICDRKKDMVVVAGFNVFPREVEQVLFTHPAVVDAAVVGLADDYRGESLHAFVVLGKENISEEAMLDYLTARLVKYKVPQVIRFVQTLPKTAVGKTDHKALKAVDWTGHP
jgi:long-chain acyl-CoA synthetase